MRIIAIRHLPTRLNLKGLLQGLFDEPISPPTTEMEQVIQSNVERLRTQPAFSKILVSALKRTAMTADCYGYPMEKECEPLLNELDFGSYAGKPKAQMLATVGDQWFNSPQTLTLGEPLENLGKRVNRLLSKYSEMESLLIFGHGAWIRALIVIAEYGNINLMNQIEIGNNELHNITINE